MTRENAKNFITQTIFEFKKMVMDPLNRNINYYDTENNDKAVRLHEQFSRYSNAVKNISEVSDSISELDDTQISQLLFLCKDISELYDLPVHGEMPDGEVLEGYVTFKPHVYIVDGTVWTEGKVRDYFKEAEKIFNENKVLIKIEPNNIDIIESNSYLTNMNLTEINAGEFHIDHEKGIDKGIIIDTNQIVDLYAINTFIFTEKVYDKYNKYNGVVTQNNVVLIAGIAKYRTVAHEIGHRLGLNHIEYNDPDNLMYDGSLGEGLTPEQAKTANRNIPALAAGRI
jgi:hypothetical protein